MESRYEVQRVSAAAAPAADWGAPMWREVPALDLGRAPWEARSESGPPHRPRTQARLGWDEGHLHVIFRVEDRWVRAATVSYQGPVCEDSCVELFFNPGAGPAESYFNIEANCAGVLLVHYQPGKGRGVVPVSEEDARQLAVTHTLRGPIDPEIATPITWCLAYRVPVAVLERYAPVQRPAPGTRWRANLYKCGEATSHPHWLCWAPVRAPRPDFHRPECFGTLLFL